MDDTGRPRMIEKKRGGGVLRVKDYIRDENSGHYGGREVGKPA